MNPEINEVKSHFARLDLSVKDIMSENVSSLSRKQSLAEAYRRFSDERIRHLPITDEKNKLIGLLTHRDLLEVALSCEQGGDLSDSEWMKSILIEEVMKRNILGQVQTIAATESARTAAIHLRENKIGCLVVVDDVQSVVGIVTLSDFVRLFHDE